MPRGNSKYRIVGLVGQGQFGRVFCAVSRQTGQFVALKELSNQRSTTQQFLREFEFLFTLQHPNIVNCQSLEHTSVGRYLAMDYCEGGTLRSLLKQEHPLLLGETLDIVMEILAGLAYTHNKGIVHCDLKPENILLNLNTSGWLARLSDFGIARPVVKATGQSSQQSFSIDASVGSPAYIAPERFFGLYSTVSDIYSVGILLFEMILGYRPFSGTPGQLMWSHLNQRVVLPDIIPEPLRDIIKKALEKLPARRFANANEMAEAIKLARQLPSVKEALDRTIPLITTNSIDQDLSADTSTQLEISLIKRFEINAKDLASVSPSRDLFKSGANCLYSAIKNKLAIWQELQSNNEGVDEAINNLTILKTSEIIGRLVTTNQGCWVFTKKLVYFVSKNQPKSLNEVFCLLDLNPHVEKKNGANLYYTATINQADRYLVLASADQLQFYYINQEINHPRTVKLIKSIHTGTKALPRLIFLDNKHLLSIWQSNKQYKETVLRLYTRKGFKIGDLRLPSMALILLAQEPYTLLGICSEPNPVALLIKLWPLQVIRIPLNRCATCACVAKYGYVICDNSGKILIFDGEGTCIGNFDCPIIPKAIACWGDHGLVVAGEANEYIYLEVKLENP